MTAILSALVPFQQLVTPIQVTRNHRQENFQNSGKTTRSGTPEGKDASLESHDNSYHGTPVKGSPPDSAFEIGIKPKKKLFKDPMERQRFVHNYQIKLKTELCKNYELRGWCKFGDNCSFAHGKHELQEKVHLHYKYKTKPCQQFHVHGHCSYGVRCQYLHTEALIPNIFYKPSAEVYMNSERANYSYTLLSEIFKLVNADCKVEKILNKIPKRARLPVFEEITRRDSTNEDFQKI